MLETIKATIDSNKYFVYGVVCGAVMTFFDKEGINMSTISKLMVFGLINEFTRRVFVGFDGFGYFNPQDENQLMGVTIPTAILVFFFLKYMFEDGNWIKFISGLLKKVGIIK